MTSSPTSGHIPVLLHPTPDRNPIMEILQPRAGERVIDVTLGLAGHAMAFLQQTSPDGELIGLDADEENLALARDRLAPFASRVTTHHANFRDIATLDLPAADILFADLGLSSPHVDDPARGFTFRADAPLDLRFDRAHGKTAAEFLRTTDERDIAYALATYADVPASRRLASLLFHHARRTQLTTGDVRGICEELYSYKAPALLPQVFQALRIAVNDEMGALNALLASIPRLLKPGGRCGIITYHSLEDRLVKRAFRALSTPVKDPLTGAIATQADATLLTPKSVTPSTEEVAANPRARSARFRAILWNGKANAL